MSAAAHRSAQILDFLALPPHSIEAEQATLGGLLIDNSAWPDVASILTAADFYRADHRLIFDHIGLLIEVGDPADVITLAEHIDRAGKLEEVGGQAYIGSLAINTASAANILRYAMIVREHAQRREIAAIGSELQAAASAPGADVGSLRREAEKRLSTITPITRKGVGLDWADLATRQPPERVWAMFMWIAMCVPTLLVGAGGAGKTLFMLQLGACLALARRFVDDIPRALRILMWCCEDDADELWRRMVNIARWLGVSLEDFADKFVIIPRLGLENTLFCTEYGRPIFTPAFDELRAQAADFRADVLLLDNSAQLFGGDENNRHDVTGFMNGLIGAHRNRAVILASHPSRSAGSEFAGSSAWENSVRTRLYLGRAMPDQRSDDDEEADDAVRYLARRKANYGPRDYLKLEFKDGVLIPDPVEAEGGIVGHVRDQQVDRIVFEGMRKLAAMGLRMTDGANSPHFLPRQLLEYKLAEGRGKGELASAMRRLMMADKIKRATVGHYANRSPMQGLVITE